MLEIEVKYALPEPEVAIAQLLIWNAERFEERTDEDLYLAAPDRDFKQTGEAFRIRRIGDRNLLTYKGPNRRAIAKTREEIEIPLASGDEVAEDTIRLFERLGYTSVAIVSKNRQVYRFNRDGFSIEACIDEVFEVGTFIEIEILAEEDRLALAEAAVLRVAADLGLIEQVRRSYLGLLLAKRGAE